MKSVSVFRQNICHFQLQFAYGYAVWGGTDHIHYHLHHLVHYWPHFQHHLIEIVVQGEEEEQDDSPSHTSLHCRFDGEHFCIP